jgi:hypothetical protein
MLSYQHVFSRRIVFSATIDGPPPVDLTRAVALLANGRLRLALNGEPMLIDLGVAAAVERSTLLFADQQTETATTPDGRYVLTLEAYQRGLHHEFWLQHVDLVEGGLRRLKLHTELPTSNNGHAETARTPRLSVLPGGTLFLADDGGIVRLYDAMTLAEAGAFQVAQPGGENCTIALAAGPDGGLIAALSALKTVVLYSLSARRTIFVRQIRDASLCYAPHGATISFTHDAALIVTAAFCAVENADHAPVWAACVNAFRQAME